MSSCSEDDLMHTFNGITFTIRTSPELLKSLDTFDAREDDILLVSYPKSEMKSTRSKVASQTNPSFYFLSDCDDTLSPGTSASLPFREEHLQITGTHWLAEILMHLYAPRVSLTSPIEFGDLSKLDQLDRLSGKRIIPTHLDGNMLPPAFTLKQCKAIYIIRNPKDIAVSMYHYYRDNPNLPTIDSWPVFLEMFLRGDVVCGSWFDHVLSWEKHTDDKNTLFLFYEDMKQDLPKVVKKVSAFLALNTSESRIHEICKKSSFSEMKTNTEKENDPNHTVCALTSNRKLVFRKGAVGDWKNHFTPKQNRMFEETLNKKMKFSEVAKHLVYEF